jgi:hypothetical protein
MVDNERVAAALPSYEIGSELGRGACGVVLAGQHRQLGRLVAIKQLPRAFGADPAVRARFLAEARVLATLDHPHVVAIYDFVDQEGLCLLVMERLTGGTVWTRFHAGGFTPDVSCAILLAVCAGLHHAHQHGILHRDVKPENLMFSGTGALKVTDLGIAKVIGGSSTLATRHGEILGTPAYIAPEQAQGYELTPATDVYAAGTLLYELLAGRLPFPADTDPATLLYRHVHEAPPPLIETAHAIPIDLAEVTDRAISKSPADRYQSAEAFGVAIAECAAKAWGRGWLARTNVPVSASGPILTAALGEALPGERTGGATAVESAQPTNSLQEPVAGNFLPIQMLHPELRTDDAPGEAPPEIPRDTGAAPTLPPQSAPLVPVAAAEPSLATIADPGGSRDAQSAPGGGSAPPPPSMAPKPGADSGGAPPRSRRALLTVVIGLVVVAAAIGSAFALSGRNHKKAHNTAGSNPITASHGLTSPSASAPGASTQGKPFWTELTESAERDPKNRTEAGSTVLGGTLYVMGGLTTEDTATTSVEEYEPLQQDWFPGPDLKFPLHHLMAVTYQGHVVVLGGWYATQPGLLNIKGNITNLAWELDDSSKPSKWVPFPAMLDARAAGAAAVVGDDIIVSGGLGADGQLVTDAEMFDGNKWTKIGTPLAPLNHLAAVSDGHCYYAIGGRGVDEDDVKDTVESYCLATHKWSLLKSLPTPVADVGAALVGGQIVVAGGEAGTTRYASVWAYNISSNTWSNLPPMKAERHGLALLSAGPAVNPPLVFAIDGATGPKHTQPSNINEALTLP